jgi:uncharacterized protein YjbI with pentapeptide repeats
MSPNGPAAESLRTPSPEELKAIVEAHGRHVRSKGLEGAPADFAGLSLARADLRGANLRGAKLAGVCAERADFTNADLRGADLTGANLAEARLRGADLARAVLRDADLSLASLRNAELSRADLSGANLRRAGLRDANLPDADLTDARGLLASQFGGANVSGAKLPASVAAFDGLANVAEASKSTQNLFTSMLFVCAYTWLTIAGTTDAQLLNNAAPPSSKLPILGIDIPLVRFYLVAPLLLMSLYLYFQLGLQRLWEELSELPAIFPDGRSLDKKAYPWLLNVLVRAYLPRLQEGRSHLARWQAGISTLLAWGLVPATLLLAWARYLRAHDWVVTGLHVAVLAGVVGFGVGFRRLAASTLRGSERREFMWRKAWRSARGAGIVTSGAAAGLLYLLSLGVVDGYNAESVYDPKIAQQLAARYYAWDIRRWLPWTLNRVGVSPSAMLTDAVLSTKPANWAPDEPKLLDGVRGADLEHRNLRHTMGYNAFAANAYFQQSDLCWADMRECDLRRADFRGARLIGANFRFSRLGEADFRRKAVLSQARFKEADLVGAKLEEAILRNTNFEDAILQGANLKKADLTGAVLTNARLDPRPNFDPSQVKPTDLTGANLTGAVLLRADLSRANLAGANLTNARLNDATLAGAVLDGANLDGAVLDGAILKGVDLRGVAGLTRPQLAGAITDATTRLPDALDARLARAR